MLRRTVAVATALALGAACATPSEESRAARDSEAGPLPPPVAVGDYLRIDQAKSGYRRPHLSDEGCLERALRLQPAVAGVENTVKFAVMRDGSLRDFVYLNPVPPEVAEAIEAAFRSCRWAPGADPAGRPIAVWVIQPIKIAGARAP